jgi:hypothetical protein
MRGDTVGRMNFTVRLFWLEFPKAGIPLSRHLSEKSGPRSEFPLHNSLNTHLDYSPLRDKFKNIIIIYLKYKEYNYIPFS